MTHLQTSWIGVDWGTSNLRVFAVDNGGSVMAENHSDAGMGVLQPAEFEPALLALIEPWLADDIVVPVFACGMVGARQGWQEAQYRMVPCKPVSHGTLSTVKTVDSRIAVHILPGLCQTQPHDVMRGEETQLAGMLNQWPSFKGAVCLPGTHSKWVSMEEGTVSSFATFITGELYSLLSEQSLLRHSVNTKNWDNDAFLDAAVTACRAPEQTIAGLFSIRASSLLDNTPAAASRSRLSGMLIGSELGVAQHYWQDNEVVLIGASQIASLYKEILLKLTSQVRIMSATDATIAGLTATASTFLRA